MSSFSSTMETINRIESISSLAIPEFLSSALDEGCLVHPSLCRTHNHAGVMSLFADGDTEPFFMRAPDGWAGADLFLVQPDLVEPSVSYFAITNMDRLVELADSFVEDAPTTIADRLDQFYQMLVERGATRAELERGSGRYFGRQYSRARPCRLCLTPDATNFYLECCEQCEDMFWEHLPEALEAAAAEAAVPTDASMDLSPPPLVRQGAHSVAWSTVVDGVPMFAMSTSLGADIHIGTPPLNPFGPPVTYVPEAGAATAAAEAATAAAEAEAAARIPPEVDEEEFPRWFTERMGVELVESWYESDVWDMTRLWTSSRRRKKVPVCRYVYTIHYKHRGNLYHTEVSYADWYTSKEEIEVPRTLEALLEKSEKME